MKRLKQVAVDCFRTEIKRLFLLSSLIPLAFPAIANAHDGPDPVAHWVFNRRSVSNSMVDAQLGPDGKIDGQYKLDQGDHGILLSGDSNAIVLAENFQTVRKFLPTRDLTVSSCVSVNKRQPWGAIIGVLQDNGNKEKGWVLGHSKRNFYFGLASSGADDGDGMMTYISGKTDFELGKFYHVAATFDGNTMQLFVNGKLDAESKVQSGDILYPEKAPFVIGAYQDDDENFSFGGRIKDIAIYSLGAKPKWFAKEFSHYESLANLEIPEHYREKFAFVVKPYLQMATQSQITIGWQTSVPSDSVVRFGKTAKVSETSTGQGGKMIHHVTLENLEPETQYFYQVHSSRGNESVKSDVLTFQTASKPNTPIAFAIISDTQGNPDVAGKVAKMAWAQRPNFLIHPGDLVSTGTNDSHWTEHFFPPMQQLVGRVPMYPVLGNHEVNAKNYYDYFQLPAPEYYYQFRYGDAHFFMIDSNKDVSRESEQYQWLEKALANSNSIWKFVVHHHPAYSSDENDYGDLWKTNTSTRGDLRVRVLSELYDKHQVDIVFNGHIHSYERTWPVFNNTIKQDQGTIYMITGGGGGGLETPGPYRPFFQNNVKRGHHYCMAYLNGKMFELKAFDLDGRLFDYLKLEK